jgi:hypothetical protein
LKATIHNKLTLLVELCNNSVILVLKDWLITIAAKMIVLVFIDGCINPADILSKHWGHQQVHEILQPLLAMDFRKLVDYCWRYASSSS